MFPFLPNGLDNKGKKIIQIPGWYVLFSDVPVFMFNIHEFSVIHHNFYMCALKETVDSVQRQLAKKRKQLKLPVDGIWYLL